MKGIHLERECRNLTRPVEQIAQNSDNTSNQTLNQNKNKHTFLFWKNLSRSRADSPKTLNLCFKLVFSTHF